MFYVLSAILVGLFLLPGCQTDGVEPDKVPKIAPKVTNQMSHDYCGENLESNLQDENGEPWGKFSISNNAEALWLQVPVMENFEIEKILFYRGSIGKMPLESSGNPDLKKFKDISSTKPTSGGAWEYQIPLANLQECFELCFQLTLKNTEDGAIRVVYPAGKRAGKAGYAEWCLQSCEAQKAPCTDATTLGKFKTWAVSDWSNEEKGKKRIDQHFATAFPSGVTIGCDFQWKITSAAQLHRLQPFQGEPTFSSTGNPGSPAFKNELLGNLISLTLNLGFDRAMPEFGSSDFYLGDLIISEGPFTGWTVTDISGEANQAWGRCTSNYSPKQLNEVISAINTSFIGGKNASGFLICPIGK